MQSKPNHDAVLLEVTKLLDAKLSTFKEDLKPLIRDLIEEKGRQTKDLEIRRLGMWSGLIIGVGSLCVSDC